MTTQDLTLTPGAIRALALFLPLLISIALWHTRSPGARLRGAIYLAALWNMATLLAVHLIAASAGWWLFEAVGGVWLGMPVDVFIGWILLWSAVPVLGLHRLPIPFVIAILFGFDLLFMPHLEPVLTLGPHWLAGEALAISIGLAPALVLARLTADDRRLEVRVALQVVLCGGLVFFIVPAAAVGALGLSASGLLAEWSNSGRPLPSIDLAGRIALNLLAVTAVIGLSAVLDFARRGDGTPFPWDPPKRLVTSGLYAYVANPMQIAGSASMMLWGVVLESPMVMLAALNAAAFSAGIAAFSERSDLDARFGVPWRDYRRNVRDWWPRWRPFRPVWGAGEGEGKAATVAAVEPARLYVAASCATCSEVGRWVARRRPIGLRIMDARDHPHSVLSRIAYDPMDGGPEEDGVRAIGRALEHMNLGWAILGAGMRLPIFSNLLQMIVDASGGGPRSIEPMDQHLRQRA